MQPAPPLLHIFTSHENRRHENKTRYMQLTSKQIKSTTNKHTSFSQMVHSLQQQASETPGPPQMVHRPWQDPQLHSSHILTSVQGLTQESQITQRPSSVKINKSSVHEIAFYHYLPCKPNCQTCKQFQLTFFTESTNGCNEKKQQLILNTREGVKFTRVRQFNKLLEYVFLTHSGLLSAHNQVRMMFRHLLAFVRFTFYSVNKRLTCNISMATGAGL